MPMKSWDFGGFDFGCWAGWGAAEAGDNFAIVFRLQQQLQQQQQWQRTTMEVVVVVVAVALLA